VRHHGRGPGPGAAAHPSGDEYHVRALQKGLDTVLVLHRGLLPDLGDAARPQAACQLRADGEARLGIRAVQRLLIGVDRDERHVLEAHRDHPVDAVAAAAAHADDLDHRRADTLRVEKLDVHVPSPHEESKMSYLRRNL
jgi:hypothetical protein